MWQADVLVEWFAYLLAMIAWSAYFYLTARNSKKVELRQAGEPLRKWTGRFMSWFVAGSCFLLVVSIVFIMFHFSVVGTPDFFAFFMVGNLITLAVQLSSRRGGMEFCSKGIVICRNGARNFIPWEEMEFVRVNAATGRVIIEEPEVQWRPFKIPPTDIEAAVAILRQFVPVRDMAGRLLNPEFKPDKLRTSAERPRWQFSLRTALLLTVLASCTLSWYSIHYRREAARDTLLVKLQKFGLQVNPVNRSKLYFDPSSPKKLQDDDLQLIAQWPGLSKLSLCGMPITDAGLEYLKDVQTLRDLDLRVTQVTAEGVKKLKRELPHCKIESQFDGNGGD